MTHLTHGWEPGLDASDSLLRRFVLATADRSAAIAGLTGGTAMRTEELSAADAGSPVVFDNVAVLLQPPAYIALHDTVSQIVAWYPPERHFVLLSAFPTPDLAVHGLALMGHPPLMYRPAGGTAPPPPDGLDVRAVADADRLEDFIRTLVEAYPMPAAGGTGLADPRILDDPGVRLFVGYLDGRAVATAGARVGHGVNDVEWVSARPEVRRRGVGAALTWAATLAAPGLPAVLIASDDGQGLYAAMGYTRLLRLTIWHRPPADPANIGRGSDEGRTSVR